MKAHKKSYKEHLQTYSNISRGKQRQFHQVQYTTAKEKKLRFANIINFLAFLKISIKESWLYVII